MSSEVELFMVTLGICWQRYGLEGFFRPPPAEVAAEVVRVLVEGVRAAAVGTAAAAPGEGHAGLRVLRSGGGRSDIHGSLRLYAHLY